MTLSDWIKDMGAIRVANLLECEHNTVYYWRDLTTIPKPEMMRAIVKATHGLVTYEEIIEPYFAHKESQG